MIEMFYDCGSTGCGAEEIDRGKFIIELKDGTHKAVEIDELEEKGFGEDGVTVKDAN
jgi:formate dehydrogenase subunit beta